MAESKKKATLTLVVVYDEIPDTSDLKNDLVEVASGYGRVIQADLDIHGPSTIDLR